MRLERIASLDDPRVEDYRDLKDRDLRGRRNLFLCEGRHGVRRLVEQGRFRPRSVFVSDRALEALRDVLETLPDSVPVYVAERAVLCSVVGYDMHRGCVAAVDRGAEPGPETLFAAAGRPSLLVVLEQLTNPDNVGGVFRNAEAFGADGVWLCPRCSDPLYRKAVRVSMGGALVLPFARSTAEGWRADLEKACAAGYRLVALDARGELEVSELAALPELGDRLLLAVGSEGDGLSAELLARADRRVRIDMAPGADSLNVATACAVALHALARRPGGALAGGRDA